MSFELLSEPIRRYIRDKGWEELRPIQNAAISKILTTEQHYILASRTASGKTEAAFLPILSKCNFYDSGVQVLYISPLIALINDQFFRVEELCKNLDVLVTRWHGEANRSLKEKLIKDPSGVVLITPESIEAMFVNRPYDVKHLFANLKFVVIDEIHSFIGTDRGIQLKSLLSRLQEINVANFRVVGLSATIGDYQEAKKFTGDELNTTVLLDRTKKDINAVFKYFEGTGAELPLDLLKDLYLSTSHSKALIFPNSRGRAEEVAVKLKKISERVNGHPHYFSHHSSVHKEVREYVEYFAKNNKYENFCIACTSTLELGIDIGNVDEVVQIDATQSIASLIQRVGRSGRRVGGTSNLFLYATEQWSLLQSIACWLLYKEEYIEPPSICNQPYDLLLHQALSIVKGHSGIQIPTLMSKLTANVTFKEIPAQEIREIIDHLIATDMLEKLQNEVIIGVEGEKIVNSRDFYSSFETEENFKVINTGNTIGEIPYSQQLREDENILLAARIWKISYIDLKSKKIEVIAAKDGKPPKFFGGSGAIDHKILEKMLEILYDQKEYEFLDQPSKDQLADMRKYFSTFNIDNFQNQRPILVSDKYLRYYTFAGTKIFETLGLLFKIAGIKADAMEHTSFETNLTLTEFQQCLLQIANGFISTEKIEAYLSKLILENALPVSKWGVFLPTEYQVKLVLQKHYDLAATMSFIKPMELVTNSEYQPKSNLDKDEGATGLEAATGMDFVAIDFETATSKRDSACEIGLTFVEGGKIVETKSWLIKPKYQDFDHFNVLVHGITAKDVEGKPEFNELWKEIKPLLENKFLIAHNASFDLSVLRKTLESYQLPSPTLSYTCSYIFSKKVWEGLPAYDLKTLCKINNIDFKHHRAGSDSKATAQLALKAFEVAGISSLVDFSEKLKVTIGELYSNGYQPSEAKRNYKTKELTQITGDSEKHNPHSIFYGRTVVFTGTLFSMIRTEAQQVIADIGGIVGNGVTLDTDFLVVGQQDYRVVGEDGMSNKQEKAIQLIKKGSVLEILSEEDFLKNL